MVNLLLVLVVLPQFHTTQEYPLELHNFHQNTSHSHCPAHNWHRDYCVDLSWFPIASNLTSRENVRRSHQENFPSRECVQHRVGLSLRRPLTTPNFRWGKVSYQHHMNMYRVGSPNNLTTLHNSQENEDFASVAKQIDRYHHDENGYIRIELSPKANGGGSCKRYNEDVSFM